MIPGDGRQSGRSLTCKGMTYWRGDFWPYSCQTSQGTYGRHPSTFWGAHSLTVSTETAEGGWDFCWPGTVGTFGTVNNSNHVTMTVAAVWKPGQTAWPESYPPGKGLGLFVAIRPDYLYSRRKSTHGLPTLWKKRKLSVTASDIGHLGGASPGGLLLQGSTTWRVSSILWRLLDPLCSQYKEIRKEYAIQAPFDDA